MGKMIDPELAQWAERYGSPRLQRCVAEGIECGAVYRDERLALERPGWLWIGAGTGAFREPRNPPDPAFALLDKARRIDPTAALEYLLVCADGGAGYSWVGYVATAQFLGRRIVYSDRAESCTRTAEVG